MRTLRTIGPDHLVDVVSVITVRVTVVVAYNGELKLSLCELRWEFPIADSKVLLGHQSPERVREHEEPDLELSVEPRWVSACAEARGDRNCDLGLDKLRNQLTI